MPGRHNRFDQEPVDCFIVSVWLEPERREVDFRVPSGEQSEIALKGVGEIRRDLQRCAPGPSSKPVAKLAGAHSLGPGVPTGVHRLT